MEAPRGERCRAGVPHGHWKTTTFTRALAGVRDAIKAAGASLLYLPPYSPDFNAIENAY
ncbi:hypothetical protein X766_33880 [Mesorhizobium sp. LSJC255A00]|nr:hypothetical protein X766_33880 [Mesorhizobium sp. LSJC255A00]